MSCLFSNFDYPGEGDGVPVYSLIFFRVVHHYWKVVCVWRWDVRIFEAEGPLLLAMW